MTITRRLKQQNLKSRVAPKKPFISEINRKKRIQWAKNYKNWSAEQWKRVLWSDESAFILYWSGRKMVWRRVNERYLKDCLRSSIKGKSKQIMIWGCFAANGVGKLHKIDGIMNAKKYKNILIHQMRPSAKKLFPNNNYTFQHDNDPKHTANIVKSYLSNSSIQVLSWPPQSPDLNPIENLWKIVKERCKDRKPKNLEEYSKILQTVWEGIEVQTLAKLVESMPKRCAEVIKNKGYPIKY